MCENKKDCFWSVILWGFTILVVVVSVLATLDNKVHVLSPMEYEALKNIDPMKKTVIKDQSKTESTDAKK